MFRTGVNIFDGWNGKADQFYFFTTLCTCIRGGSKPVSIVDVSLSAALTQNLKKSWSGRGQIWYLSLVVFFLNILQSISSTTWHINESWFPIADLGVIGTADIANNDLIYTYPTPKFDTQKYFDGVKKFFLLSTEINGFYQ